MTNFDADTPLPIDYNRAWYLCGQDDDAPTTFCEAIDDSLVHYRWKRASSSQITRRESQRHFQKITKRTSELLALIEESEETYGLHLYSHFDEPEGVDESGKDYIERTIGTKNEGLEYYEIQLHTLKELLRELHGVSLVAHTGHTPPKGRPKLNEHLENTLHGLGRVYHEITGRAPMDGYSYSDIEGTYQGPFLDFATHILWAFAGKDIPTKTVIGDAARTAFGLRK